jgi:hypothetical protein
MKKNIKTLIEMYNKGKINLSELYHKLLHLRKTNDNNFEFILSEIAGANIMFLLLTYQKSQL